MKQLNPGAYNIRRKFDGKETTFIYDTPKKNGCIYILMGKWIENNGVLNEIYVEEHNNQIDSNTLNH